MKRNSCFIIVLIVMMMLAGCKSSPETKTSGPQSVAPQQGTNTNAPNWLNDLPKDGEYWGIGFAKLQNESLAMRTATSRARRDVAERISVQVQGLLIDYANESGTLNNARSIQKIETIGKDLVDLTLSGASPNARTQMGDGTWWIRVALPKEDALRDINRIVNNEMADYAEFKADQALKMLNSEIEKSRSVPTPRGED